MAQHLKVKLDTAAALTASGSSQVTPVVGDYKEGLIVLVVSGVSGTTPSLTAKVQQSPDDGTTWIDVANGAFTAITANGNAALPISNFGEKIRLVYTITGTTPSFTL